MKVMQDWIDNFNRKCAEFLNLQLIETAGGKILYDIQKLPKINIPVGSSGINATINTQLLIARLDQLQFHSDWNWIHEVKEAIRKISTVNFSVTNNYAFINSVERTENGGIGYTLGSYHGLSEKDATIQVIDQFINWYNKEKKDGIEG